MRDAVEAFLHRIFVPIARLLSRVLPDRVPVTFAGSGAVDDLCRSIAQRGFRRVLVVSDNGLVGAGVVGTVTDRLDAAGVEHTLYSGVEPDPTTDQVEAGLALYREDSCEAVVAVGGGSPMDAGKLIATLATNDKPLRRLRGKFHIRRRSAPVFAVPTTAGTGSEVTIAAVVSDPVTHAKSPVVDPKLLPTMVALDPGLTAGLPPAVTAATGIDALTHAVESYISLTANAQTEEYSRTSVRLVFEYLPRAYTDGSDEDARQAMMLAAYYGGLAFTRTSVGYVHAIAHNLGATYGTPHGHANAVALAPVLDFSLPEVTDRLADLADLIGVEGADTEERARGFIAAVRSLVESVGIDPRLAELRESDIHSLARRARTEALLDYPVPRFMTQAECEDVIRQILPTAA
ncbi:MAG: iron-containing alcohol dehydrogenase [Acidimicrobiia bacterium]